MTSGKTKATTLGHRQTGTDRSAVISAVGLLVIAISAKGTRANAQGPPVDLGNRSMVDAVELTPLGDGGYGLKIVLGDFACETLEQWFFPDREVGPSPPGTRQITFDGQVVTRISRPKASSQRPWEKGVIWTGDDGGNDTIDGKRFHRFSKWDAELLRRAIMNEDEPTAAVGFGPGDGWAVLHDSRARYWGIPRPGMGVIARNSEDVDKGRGRLRGFGFTADGGWAVVMGGLNGRGIPQAVQDYVTTLRHQNLRDFSNAIRKDFEMRVQESRSRRRAGLPYDSESLSSPKLPSSNLKIYAIRDVAFGPDGGWAVVYREGPWVRHHHHNIPQSAVDCLRKLDGEKAIVCGIGLTPRGGWAVIYEDVTGVHYDYENIPDDAVGALRELFP